MSDDIQVDVADGIARVRMTRAPVNALTMANYAELGDAFRSLSEDVAVRCVILSSTMPKAFCAGKDFNEFLSSRADDYLRDAPIIRGAFEAIRHCAVPTIAMIDGPAIGAGCTLAAMCDIRVAGERAKFILPEMDVGRCGGGSHIGRLIPQGALRRMFFTGDPMRAAEAYRVGLVDELVATDALEEATLAIARRIAVKSGVILRIGKKSINDSEYLPVDEGYVLEQGFSAEMSKTDDASEAITAIIEKRAPVFTGR